ncbi:hypothetical protein CFHF_07790 [Caulobacter flavus]|uniref:Uncharacterized protein n=1 Tax=Caulobacter flavus TaxID=1679497 RepID=A0A2N5CW19_9CAUL|nr:hypothetical protein C1707_19320 [Caulobacter flavus]PLR17990.1 hypothetical protein CFHF_07790 [Caulobacter flavus]
MIASAMRDSRGCFTPVTGRAGDNLPGRRIWVGCVEVGVAWPQKINDGRADPSVGCEGVSLSASISAKLCEDEMGEGHTLVCSRPKRPRPRGPEPCWRLACLGGGMGPTRNRRSRPTGLKGARDQAPTRGLKAPLYPDEGRHDPECVPRRRRQLAGGPPGLCAGNRGLQGPWARVCDVELARARLGCRQTPGGGPNPADRPEPCACARAGTARQARGYGGAVESPGRGRRWRGAGGGVGPGLWRRARQRRGGVERGFRRDGSALKRQAINAG